MTFEQQIKKLNDLVALKGDLETAKNDLVEAVKPLTTKIGPKAVIQNYTLSLAIRNYAMGLIDKHIELITATLTDIQTGSMDIEAALLEYDTLVAGIE